MRTKRVRSVSTHNPHPEDRHIIDNINYVTTRTRVYSVLLLLVSVFFWGWALRNTIDGKVPFDGGLVCFLLTGLAGVYGLKCGDGSNLSYCKIHMYLTALSSFFVFAIYAAVLVYLNVREETKENKDDDKFPLVYAVPCGAWLVAGVVLTVWSRELLHKATKIWHSPILLENDPAGAILQSRQMDSLYT
jgi:hypothetical protein